MSGYEFTERGEEIAQAAGLDEIVKSFGEEDRDNPLGLSLFGSSSFYMSYDEIEENRKAFLAGAVRRLLPDDIHAYGAALGISESDRWRYSSGRVSAHSRLFGVVEILPHTPADERDPFVLSGAMGFGFSNIKMVKAFLQDKHYEDFGFLSRVEAAAFAGAYIASKLVELDNDRMHGRFPSFEITEGRIKKRISVGATMHGDLRILQSEIITEGIITPINKPAEFCPSKETVVAGYHSMETAITAAMLEAAYLNGGPAEAYGLIQAFSDIITDLSTGLPGNIEYQRGNFADYGEGDLHYELVGFHALVKDRRTGQEAQQKVGAPYLPQSSTMFGVTPGFQAITISNWNEDTESREVSINIRFEHFTDLFKCLLKQAQAGLGRTAPYQHIATLKAASMILQDSESSDWLRS